jgi:hypothetical protein
MSIKRYKDIASMQNPGKQRTGKAGGGRVGATEGGRDWKLMKKAGTKIKDAAKDVDTYERIAKNIGVPFAGAMFGAGKAIREKRQESGKPAVGSRIKKRRAKKKAAKE